jgi:hypothetical protein
MEIVSSGIVILYAINETRLSETDPFLAFEHHNVLGRVKRTSEVTNFLQFWEMRYLFT